MCRLQEYLGIFASDLVSEPKLQEGLISCRATALSIRESVLISSKDASLTARLLLKVKHPVDYFARQLSNTGIFELADPDSFPLQTEICHRFLCVIALSLASQRVLVAKEDPSDLAALGALTMKRFNDFLETRIKPVRPDIARGFDKSLHPLGKDQGSEFFFPFNILVGSKLTLIVA